MRNKHILFRLGQGFLAVWLLYLAACLQHPFPLTQPVAKEPPLAEVPGQLQAGGQTDTLRFSFRKPAGFATQKLDLTGMRYLRIWVRGPGINERMWNKEGFVAVQENLENALTVAGIPKGPNRIVTAQGYDFNQQPLPGLTLKAVYSSPPKESQVKVMLKWRFVPLGETLEALLEKAPDMAKSLDTARLQQAMDQLIYGALPVDGKDFAKHPTQLRPQAIADYLAQRGGAVPPAEAMPADWIMTPAVTVFVRDPAGNSLNLPVTLWADDPASAPVTIPAGQGQGVLTGLSPGTWTVRARYEGPAGPEETQAALTVAADGSVSLTAGTAQNPLMPVKPKATCQSFKQANPQAPDGLYWLNPNGAAPFQAYCDMTQHGGGWTLVFHFFNHAGFSENNFTAAYGHNRFTDKTWRYSGGAYTSSFTPPLAPVTAQGALDINLFNAAFRDVRMSCNQNSNNAAFQHFVVVKDYTVANGNSKLLGAAPNGTAYPVLAAENSQGSAQVWHDNELDTVNSGHYLCDTTNNGAPGGTTQFSFCYTDHLNNPNGLDMGDSIVAISFGTSAGNDGWSQGFTAECGPMGATSLLDQGTVSIWVR